MKFTNREIIPFHPYANDVRFEEDEGIVTLVFSCSNGAFVEIHSDDIIEFYDKFCQIVLDRGIDLGECE
jgi:hypothetical protein